MSIACSKTCEDRHRRHDELCRCVTWMDRSRAFCTDIARSNGFESPQVLNDSHHPSTGKFKTLVNGDLSEAAIRWLCSKHRNGTCSNSIRCSSDCDPGHTHSNCGKCRTGASLQQCKGDGCSRKTEAINGATGNQGKSVNCAETGKGCAGNCGTGDPQGKGRGWRCHEERCLAEECSSNQANSIDRTEGCHDVIEHCDSLECSATKCSATKCSTTKCSTKHESYRVQHGEETSKVAGDCAEQTYGPSIGKLDCDNYQGDRRNKGDDGETNCCERSSDQGEALVIDESALFDTDRRNDAERTVNQVGVCRECQWIWFYFYHEAAHWMILLDDISFHTPFTSSAVLLKFQNVDVSFKFMIIL